MNSSPTILKQTTFEYEKQMIQTNESNFDILLATLTPGLFVIWQNLKLYQVNPEIIPPIIRAIGDISLASKLGEVIVEIRPDQQTGEAIVQRIRAVDTHTLGLSANKTY